MWASFFEASTTRTDFKDYRIMRAVNGTQARMCGSSFVDFKAELRL
jgi:hypothetical protein